MRNEIKMYKICALDEKRAIIHGVFHAYKNVINQNYGAAEFPLSLAASLWGGSTTIEYIKGCIAEKEYGEAKTSLERLIEKLITNTVPAEYPKEDGQIK